jgi:hypothetical protein
MVSAHPAFANNGWLPWGAVMRLLAVLAACIGVAVSACNTLDAQYFNQGIGTELDWAGLPNETQLQDIYVEEICRQADLAGCGPGMPPALWMTFVQAGMNDIDQRCDAYLAWLDNRRRWHTPVINEVSAIQTATAAMVSPHVGAHSLAIIAAAFGLATNTITNIDSRLITEIDNSTVQAIVLTGEKRFRLNLQGRDADGRPIGSPALIVDRPAALYVLRSYLRLCMPFNIEMEINNSVTVLSRTNGSIAPPPVVNGVAVKAAVAARLQTVQGLRESSPSGARKPLPGGGGTPDGGTEPLRAGDGNNAIERRMPITQLEAIQANLCVVSTGHFDENTRKAIQQAKIGARQSSLQISGKQPFSDTKNEIESDYEAQIFRSAKDCSEDFSGVDRGYQTAFEKFRFNNEQLVKILQDRLKKCKGVGSIAATGKFDAATRTAIEIAKNGADEESKKTFSFPGTGKMNSDDYRYIAFSCT